MKTPFLGGHICISTTLITKVCTFFSAECKLFFFFNLVEKKNSRVFIKLDRVEREDREQTDISLYRKALWEWNNVICNSLIPCYGVCNVIVMACCWSVLLFSLSSLCFIFVLSTFQPGKFTILAACAFNAKRELCSWDSYSCILSNSAWRGQLVLATHISGRSPFLILFLRWCKASPCSPFHIARRRVKMLAFPLLTFFFFLIFPPLQNAFGNEMPNFSSSSSSTIKISVKSKYSLHCNRIKRVKQTYKSCPAGWSLRCVWSSAVSMTVASREEK